MSLLEIKNLKVHYPIRGGFFNKVVDHVYAVDGVSMVIEQGKTYGLIGESGSGKSTIGKTIIGLEKATAGEILYNGKNILDPKVRKELKFNSEVQMIFQDSMSSLNPKKRVLDILAEPIRNFEKLSKEEVKKITYDFAKKMGYSNVVKYEDDYETSEKGFRNGIPFDLSVDLEAKNSKNGTLKLSIIFLRDKENKVTNKVYAAYVGIY